MPHHKVMNLQENTEEQSQGEQEEQPTETLVIAVLREEILFAVIVALRRFTFNAGKSYFLRLRLVKSAN